MPQDEQALRELDTSYETNRVFEVEKVGLGFRLVSRQLPEARRQGFDVLAHELGSEDKPWTDAWVATDPSGSLVGFVATSFESWNARLRLWHLYTAPRSRRGGVARRLVEEAAAEGRRRHAVHLFVETPSVNAPAIAAYERLGFHLVGLDSSLYDGTPAAGETAVPIRAMRCIDGRNAVSHSRSMTPDRRRAHGASPRGGPVPYGGIDVLRNSRKLVRLFV